MKSLKSVVSFVFILITSLGFSQERFNQFSIEASTGYTSPLNTYIKDYKSNFSGFTNLNLGVRYMINENLGLRAEYVNDRFENDPGGKIGTYYNRFGVQGVYNVGKLVGLPYLASENIGLLLHGGVGYTSSKPIGAVYYERIGSAIIGLTPQVKITNQIAFFTDLSLVTNFKQHYRFDGSLISPEYKPVVGNHYNLSFGIMFYFGNKNYHADWY